MKIEEKKRPKMTQRKNMKRFKCSKFAPFHKLPFCLAMILMNLVKHSAL